MIHDFKMQIYKGLKKCIQLNKYEADPFFLQIISMFCKSCKPICEPKITPVLYHFKNQNKNNFMFSVQFTNLTKA